MNRRDFLKGAVIATAGTPFWMGDRRWGTVLGGKGSLRRGSQRRAVASCAPFCRATIRDGQFLRLTKDENQCGVDKTS